MWRCHVSSMKMAVFWVVAPCSLVEVYRRFRGACCLSYQRPADRSTNHLWNVGTLLSDYTVEQLTGQPSKHFCLYPFIVYITWNKKKRSYSRTSWFFIFTLLQRFPTFHVPWTPFRVMYHLTNHLTNIWDYVTLVYCGFGNGFKWLQTSIKPFSVSGQCMTED
jgi:hypothetical protein